MENLPIDIILVRHGESEGNLAQELSKDGDDTLWTKEFSQRHTSNYRLTDIGRAQALSAGEWLKKHIGSTFDGYYCSEYVRAQETAALLGFENAKWHVEFYLREQDRGVLAGKSVAEREKNYSDLVETVKRDTFYVAPPGGESIANACLRVDRLLSLWQSHCAGQRIIAVCHGNIITAFRVRIERMSQRRYQETIHTKDPHFKMFNGHIVHYTRRDPETGEISQYPNWVRFIVPYDDSLSQLQWQRIQRPVYTNQQLLDEVHKIPQLVNNKEAEEARARKRRRTS
jgi:broad specificity phosphatase PhoE